MVFFSGNSKIESPRFLSLSVLSCPLAEISAKSQSAALDSNTGCEECIYEREDKSILTTRPVGQVVTNELEI